MTDPRQTAGFDALYGAPLCTCPHADANEPYEMHDRACVVRAVKRPREVCDFTVGVPARTHQDDYTKFLLDHDPGAPDGDRTGYVFASTSESGQEMRIIADLAAIDPSRGNWHDVFGRPLSWFSRSVKHAKRRARMARKRRRGWA